MEKKNLEKKIWQKNSHSHNHEKNPAWGARNTRVCRAKPSKQIPKKFWGKFWQKNLEKKNWKKNLKKNLKKILEKKIWKKFWEKILTKKFGKKIGKKNWKKNLGKSFDKKFFPNFFFKIFSLIFFQDPWKIHDLFMISWIIHDYSWNIHELFMNNSWNIHEIFMKYSWNIMNIFMKYSWIFKKILRRNLGENFEKKNLIHIITRKISRGVLATRVCLARNPRNKFFSNFFFPNFFFKIFLKIFSGFVSRVSRETHACCEHPTRDFSRDYMNEIFFLKIFL